LQIWICEPSPSMLPDYVSLLISYNLAVMMRRIAALDPPAPNVSPAARSRILESSRNTRGRIGVKESEHPDLNGEIPRVKI
jgi:hypothetical protein